jgi:2-polyprenyl-6-methoxyphenol hydroxylase-like FAD-dependent oxidoreductase
MHSQTLSQQTVLVIGSGIAGLCTALALSPTGRSITLLERDGVPPEGGADAAFQDWKRTGVGHLRQSHAFLARLRMIIKADHPQLLEALASEGARDLPFEGMLSEFQRETYKPKPLDAELTIITSRRTTLELTMRRYVQSLPNVSIRSGFFVRALKTQTGPDGVIDVLGVEGTEDNQPVSLTSDIVVDASGKAGGSIDQLLEQGASIHEDSESAGILYFTRHYRLKPGKTEPPRIGNPPPNGDLGFLKFGVFPADNGCFSITMCVPEIEYELRKAIVKPDIFQAMTQMLPGLKPWTLEDQAEPTSKVFGMGDLHSRWRDLAKDDRLAARNYYALGDTLIRTNPLYGRGCSFAAVGGVLLREALDSNTDADAQGRAFYRSVRQELEPYFNVMRKQDREAIKRAQEALMPDFKPAFRARLAKSFVEDAIAIALRYDTDLLREAMRGFHMLEHPEAWLKRPANLIRVLGYWARGKRRNAKAYPPKPGPDRSAMFRDLGLDFKADMMIAAETRKTPGDNAIAA